MKIEIFQYNGNPVTFQAGENNVMVSATEMAKSFGKTTKDWLRTCQAKEFISSLSSVRQICLTELVAVVQGGNNQGTWMHEDVALEFARWLSPHFAIWCNDKIKELLKTGVATVSNDDEVIMHAMNVLQRRLDESKKLAEQLTQQNRLQSEQLQISAPKAEYYDNVLQSESTYCTNRIAKEFGMSAKTLNLILKDKGIQYKSGKQWLLKHRHQNKGYTKTHTTYYTKSNGEMGSEMSTVWTEKGRQWLHEIMKPYKKEDVCGD